MLTAEQNKLVIDPQQIKDMIGIFEEYQDVYPLPDPSYSIQNLKSKYHQYDESIFLQEIHHQNTEMRKFIQDVLVKAVFMFNLLAKEYSHMKNERNEVNNLLQQKQHQIEGYKEKMFVDERNLNEMVRLYEKAKIQNVQLNDKMSEQEQQFKEETRSIHKTFMETQESNKIDKKLFEELYDNNQSLMKSISETKNEKMIVEDEYQKVLHEHEKCSQVIDRLKEKIKYLELQMMEKIQKENKIVQEPQNQFQEEEKEEEIVKDSFLQRHKKKTKLSEEVFSFRTSHDFNGSFLHSESRRHSQSDLSEVIPQYNEEDSVYEKKVTVDPYYSHYVLTSQSVKIKQDCEDMLNIDMKPFYKQIIEKRIPMHLWDQWIKNRLRELMKLDL